MTTLRLSPSGPDLLNSAGAPFDPGPGARLRLAERTTQIDPTANIIDTTERIIGTSLLASPNATQTIAQLANPNKDLNYRATASLDVFNTLDDTNVDVTLTLQASVDGGTTWANLSYGQHGVSPAVTGAASTDGEHDDAGGYRHIWCTRPLTSGAGFGVVAGTTSLMIRATLQADQVGAFADSRNLNGGNFGTFSLVLEECF